MAERDANQSLVSEGQATQASGTAERQRTPAQRDEVVGDIPRLAPSVTKEVIQFQLAEDIAANLTPVAHTALAAIMHDFFSRVYEEARQESVVDAPSLTSPIDVSHIHAGLARAKERLMRQTRAENGLLHLTREITLVVMGAGLGYMSTNVVVGALVLAGSSLAYSVTYLLRERFSRR